MFLLPDDWWQIAETREKGLGVFAKKEIKAGVVIGDYLGKIINNLDYDQELEKNGLYLMYYTDEASIFPDLGKPDIHLFNHSCEPNCHFYIYKWHTLFFASRKIDSGEELTVSYMLGPRKKCPNCTHDCKCGSRLCIGTMHLTVEKYKKWRKYQDSQLKKAKKPKVVFGKNLPKLSSYPKIFSNNPIYKIITNM